MKVFIPEILVLSITVSLVLIVIVIGFLITRINNFRISILISWLLVACGIIFTERLTVNEPAVFRMLALIMVTLFAMKVPVTIEAYKGSKVKLSFIQWLCFVVGWFGMRPKLFESFPGKALPGVKSLVTFGLSRVLIGVILLVFAKLIALYSNSFYSKIIITSMLLAGLSMILHFGILNISAGMWRLSGVDTRTLFRSPMQARSLTEFWGRRWNLAFVEMTSFAVYRPLRTSIGPSLAIIIAFLFSGLLHEIAISFPVKSGYGLPMLYFVVQGLVMMLEKAMEIKGLGISKNKLLGRVWVIFWLVLPMPLLFHPAFIKEVVWPVIGLN